MSVKIEVLDVVSERTSATLQMVFEDGMINDASGCTAARSEKPIKDQSNTSSMPITARTDDVIDENAGGKDHKGQIKTLDVRVSGLAGLESDAVNGSQEPCLQAGEAKPPVVAPMKPRLHLCLRGGGGAMPSEASRHWLHSMFEAEAASNRWTAAEQNHILNHSCATFTDATLKPRWTRRDIRDMTRPQTDAHNSKIEVTDEQITMAVYHDCRRCTRRSTSLGHAAPSPASTPPPSRARWTPWRRHPRHPRRRRHHRLGWRGWTATSTSPPSRMR